MSTVPYDFAIFGSTPFAILLAGSLARIDGKRVLRVGSRASPQRLSRRLDLALPLATRPSTWDLLIRGETETRALLHAVGAPQALVPVEVRIQADTEARAAFVGHLAHLARASGLAVTMKSRAVTIRGVPLLRAELAEEKLVEWLLSGGVKSLVPHEVRLEFARSGAAMLEGPDGVIEAKQIVLADDAALLELPADLRPGGLLAEELTSTVVGKIRTRPAPIALFPDRGVSLVLRDDGSILALVGGTADTDARLASAFAGPFPISRLATGRSHQLVSADGAPVVGRLQGSGLFVAAGLGTAAAFFAPALARYLAGVASEPEQAWVSAHDPALSRQAVTEAIR